MTGEKAEFQVVCAYDKLCKNIHNGKYPTMLSTSNGSKE